MFVDRQGAFTQTQFNTYFGFIQNAKESDVVLFVILLSTGIVCLIVGAVLLFKSITMSKAVAARTGDLLYDPVSADNNA